MTFEHALDVGRSALFQDHKALNLTLSTRLNESLNEECDVQYLQTKPHTPTCIHTHPRPQTHTHS